jgi:hypothetical protein
LLLHAPRRFGTCRTLVGVCHLRVDLAAGRVAPIATTSQVSADRRFGNGGPAPGGAGIGEPGI